MDLATIIILAGTVIGAIVYLADKHVHNNTVATRKYLLAKFKDIKSKNLKLQEEFEELIAIHTIWGQIIDTDTHINEYLEALKEKIEIEYSDAEYLKLLKTHLDKNNISEHMEKFRYHQDVLISLRQDLVVQKELLEKAAPGNINFIS